MAGSLFLFAVNHDHTIGLLLHSAEDPNTDNHPYTQRQNLRENLQVQEVDEYNLSIENVIFLIKLFLSCGTTRRNTTSSCMGLGSTAHPYVPRHHSAEYCTNMCEPYAKASVQAWLLTF